MSSDEQLNTVLNALLDFFKDHPESDPDKVADTLKPLLNLEHEQVVGPYDNEKGDG